MVDYIYRNGQRITTGKIKGGVYDRSKVVSSGVVVVGSSNPEKNAQIQQQLKESGYDQQRELKETMTVTPIPQRRIEDQLQKARESQDVYVSRQSLKGKRIGADGITDARIKYNVGNDVVTFTIEDNDKTITKEVRRELKNKFTNSKQVEAYQRERMKNPLYFISQGKGSLKEEQDFLLGVEKEKVKEEDKRFNLSDFIDRNFYKYAGKPYETKVLPFYQKTRKIQESVPIIEFNPVTTLSKKFGDKLATAKTSTRPSTFLKYALFSPFFTTGAQNTKRLYEDYINQQLLKQPREFTAELTKSPTGKGYEVKAVSRTGAQDKRVALSQEAITGNPDLQASVGKNDLLIREGNKRSVETFSTSGMSQGGQEYMGIKTWLSRVFSKKSGAFTKPIKEDITGYTTPITPSSYGYKGVGQYGADIKGVVVNKVPADVNRNTADFLKDFGKYNYGGYSSSSLANVPLETTKPLTNLEIKQLLDYGLSSSLASTGAKSSLDFTPKLITPTPALEIETNPDRFYNKIRTTTSVVYKDKPPVTVPSVTTITGQDIKPASDVRLSNSFAYGGSTKTKVVQTPKIDQTVIQKPDQKLKQPTITIPRQTSKFLTPKPTSSYQYVFSGRGYGGLSIPPVRFPFSFKSSRGRASRSPNKYTPSFTASFFNIKGKSPRLAGGVNPFVIRGIPKGNKGIPRYTNSTPKPIYLKRTKTKKKKFSVKKMFGF